MFNGLVLVMVDECGCEVEVERFSSSIANMLDEDEEGDALELWKNIKIDKAYERYPEAQRFYFEDRRSWNSIINMMMDNSSLEFEDFC